MQVFVPVEDATIDAAAGRLVPYRCGLPCAHELRGDLVLVDGCWTPRGLSDGSARRRPAPRPVFAPAPR